MLIDSYREVNLLCFVCWFVKKKITNSANNVQDSKIDYEWDKSCSRIHLLGSPTMIFAIIFVFNYSIDENSLQVYFHLCLNILMELLSISESYLSYTLLYLVCHWIFCKWMGIARYQNLKMSGMKILRGCLFKIAITN